MKRDQIYILNCSLGESERDKDTQGTAVKVEAANDDDTEFSL